MIGIGRVAKILCNVIKIMSPATPSRNASSPIPIAISPHVTNIGRKTAHCDATVRTLRNPR